MFYDWHDCFCCLLICSYLPVAMDRVVWLILCFLMYITPLSMFSLIGTPIGVQSSSSSILLGYRVYTNEMHLYLLQNPKTKIVRSRHSCAFVNSY